MRLSTCFGCCSYLVDRLFGLTSGCATIFNDAIKRKGRKGIALTHIELALELHPAKGNSINLNFQLFGYQTYQCRRSVCRNAERPSIKTKMPTVKTAQKANTTVKKMPPSQPSLFKPRDKTIVHKTSASSVNKVKLFYISSRTN